MIVATDEFSSVRSSKGTDRHYDPDREKSQRVMAAMLKMKKIELDALERAAAEA